MGLVPLRIVLPKRYFRLTCGEARGSTMNSRRLYDLYYGEYLSFCKCISSGEALFVDSGRHPVLDIHKTMAVRVGKDILGHQSRFWSKAGWFTIVVIPSLCPGNLEKF